MICIKGNRSRQALFCAQHTYYNKNSGMRMYDVTIFTEICSISDLRTDYVL